MDEQAALTLLAQLRDCQAKQEFLQRRTSELVQAAHWVWQTNRWDLVHEYVTLLADFFVHRSPTFKEDEDTEVILRGMSHHWQCGYKLLGYGLDASKQREDIGSTKRFLEDLATLAANLGYLVYESGQYGIVDLVKNSSRDYFSLVRDHAVEQLSISKEPDERWMIAYLLLR